MTDGLPQELKDIMQQVLVIEPADGGLNKYGEASHDVFITVDCYVVRDNKRARDKEGRETSSTLQAILANPTLEITSDAKLTLADGSHPRIIEIMSAHDELGNDYWLEIRA